MKETMQHIDRLSREALEHWEVQPPAKLASNIRKRMFWYNFWRNPMSKYTSIVVALLMITAIEYFTVSHFINISPSAKMVNAPSSIQSRTISQAPLSTYKVNTGNDNNYIASTNNNNDKYDKINTIASSGSQRFVSNDNTEISKVVPENVQQSIHSNTVDLNNVSAVNPVSTTNQTTVENRSTVTSNGDSSEQNNVQMNWNTKEHNFSDAELLSTAAIIKENLQTMPLNSISDNHSFPEKLFALPAKKYPLRPQFDLSINLSPLFGNTGEKKTNNISVSTNEPSGSIAITLQYNFKHWFFETGLAYSLLQTRQKADVLCYNPRDIHEQILIGQNILIDTNSYWHYYYILDSVIHVGDSVWTTEFDTTINNIYDNLNYTAFDTMKNVSWKSSISLFEIPLGLGYRFYAGHMEFNVKGGIILGIASQLRGNTWMENTSAGLVALSESYATKGLQFSWYVSATAIKPLDERWAIMLSPSWRSSINGFKGNEGIPTRSYHSWGIGLGLRYSF